MVVGANKPPRLANHENSGVEAQALRQPPRPVANTRGLALGTTTSSAMNQARPLSEPALTHSSCATNVPQALFWGGKSPDVGA